MLTIKLKCPKHPRYDPTRQGEAGIRGGCIGCYELFHLWRLSEMRKAEILDRLT